MAVKKKVNVPDRERRRQEINEGRWSRPNITHRSVKDYNRQKMRSETRKEAER